MSEGLFNPFQYNFPDPISAEILAFSTVKVIPDRTLLYEVFTTKEEADKWSTGFEADEDGFETMRVGFYEDELKQVNDPAFCNQLLVHEFCELYNKGGTEFPASSKIKGSASGIFISEKGHIATNFHIASGIVEAKGFAKTGRFSGKPIPAPSLSVEILSDITSDNELIYKPVDEVSLVGSFSKTDAYGKRADLTTLKIDHTPRHFLDISREQVNLQDKVFNIGFTMRTARPPERLKSLSYKNANYDLRVSSGHVIQMEENSFLSDADGGPGNSGSATIDSQGKLVGIYCGSLGNGLVDPTGIRRRHSFATLLEKIVF